MSQPAPVMEFIGVSTRRSGVRELFPLWVAELGIPEVHLVGRDLPLDAEPARYREAVERIASIDSARGALVTSHKVGLFDAARDLFHEFDPYAGLTREVSCISKRDGRLIGHAKDPVTAARTLRTMLGDQYFATTGGHVLCLGAGGAGLAIVVHLLERTDRPERVIVTDVRAERLAEIRAVVDRLDTGTVAVDCVPAVSGDSCLVELPSSSLVVNATGMGKDRAGSPLNDRAWFPRDAVVWDLNYRGKLEFLRQARRQRRERALRIEDGWLYFIHGWSEHIAEVFDIDLTPESFERLRNIADQRRPRQGQLP